MLTFVEAPLFTKYVHDYLDEPNYLTLQVMLSGTPDLGDIIPKSGGIRKLRWAAKGKGKRGGVRIIYYWQKADGEIWLLTLYAKNEADSIPAHVLRELLKEFEEE